MSHRVRMWRKNALLCSSMFFAGLQILGGFSAQALNTTSFTLMCMPDPQNYTTYDHPLLYDMYSKQSRWIRDNKTALNTKHVIWLGDLTNDNTITQWNTATQAYTILEDANISYAVVPGNHEYKTMNSDRWAGANLRNLNLFNAAVGPNRFVNKAWYGGNFGNTTTHNENNYTYFSASGLDFLVIGLEYAPRKEVITWANNLISQHPSHRVILFTHAYLTASGNYGGSAASSTATVGASGSDLFNELASRHSNLFMVVCGHVTESHTNSKVGLNGNTVYEMLVDYQSETVKGTGDSLGNGWLRVLQFDPSKNKIQASTITPAAGDSNIFLNGQTQFYNSRYSHSPTAADHQFTLNYDMGPMAPYSYLVSSTGFHAMGVGDNLYSDQMDPDVAQADNANFVGVWEDDSDKDGVYRIMMRGFDSDGNERFPKTVVNTELPNIRNAINPAIAMTPDGRYVVAWESGRSQISMRRFNADGTPLGDDQVVVTVPASGVVNMPDVAIDDAGNCTIVWADDVDGNAYFQIAGRGFKWDGTEKFQQRTINMIASGQQLNPKIAMAADGRSVVTWKDDKDGTWDVQARGFGANDLQSIPQFNACTVTAGEQTNPDIAMDDTGRFVIIWEDDTDLNKAYQIQAHGFEANGTEKFKDMTVNLIGSGNQIGPSVAMDSNGYWYAAWEDNGIGGTGYQMNSNAFDLTGQRVKAEDLIVNPATSVSHGFGSPVRKTPVITAHRSGRYVVTWADDMDGNGDFQVLACGVGNTARSLAIKSLDGIVTRNADDAFYAPNELVQLTATGKPGFSFVKWSGAVSSAANPITLTMDTNKVITAEYARQANVGDWELY